MTTRTIGAMACVLALGGCETKHGRIPEGPSPGAVTGPGGVVAFLKRLPANPMGRPLDGLVPSKEWAGLDWADANSAEVSTWKWTKWSDDVVLIVKVKAGRDDKAAISRPVGLALADKGTLRMDLYNNSDRKIRVAFGVFASVDRVYYESKPRTVQPGWNRVVFDIAASTFKSGSSEWKHTTRIWKREDIRELALVFYDKAGATFVVDSVEIDAEPSQDEEAEKE